jgi:hypothetical protein
VNQPVDRKFSVNTLDQFVIFKSTRDDWFGLVVCSMVALLYVFIGTHPETNFHLPFQKYAFAVALSFAASASRLAYRIKVRPEAIIISPEGITDNASICKVGLIPWREIVKVESFPLGKQPYLGIFVRDLNKLLSVMSPLRRKNAEALSTRLPTPIFFNPRVMGMPLEQLVEKIQTGQKLWAGAK